MLTVTIDPALESCLPKAISSSISIQHLKTHVAVLIVHVSLAKQVDVCLCTRVTFACCWKLDYQLQS